MKVVGIEPHTDHVLVVVVEGEPSTTPKISYYDTIKGGVGDRAVVLATIRTRLHGFIDSQCPTAVVVKPLEQHALRPASKKNVQYSWFETAEVRGISLEACAAGCGTVRLRDGAAVTRSIGERKGKEYVQDNAYWETEVEGVLSNKKFRPAALMAISALKDEAQ